MHGSLFAIRRMYLATGVAAMLFAGVIYAWSILKVPLAEHFGWSSSALALNFTVTMCSFCLGGFFGSLVAKRIGAKAVICIGGVLAGFGFVFTSQLGGRSILTLYLAYGLFSGLGIGCAYVAIISTVSAWFPEKKGLCSGLLMMGFGASTLLVGQIANQIIHHVGWRVAFLVLGVLVGTVILAAGFIIWPPNTNVNLPQPKMVKTVRKESFESKDYTTGEMLRRFAFWRAFLCIVFLAAVGNTVISFARDLCLSVGASAGMATTLVGVLSVCNGLGRIATGLLFDAAGRRVTMITANLATIIAAAVTLSAVLLQSVFLCVAGLCLVGLSYGSSPTFSSAFTAAFYGIKHFPTNFSVMNFILIGASLIATAANTLLASYDSYVPPCMLLLLLSIMALLLNLSIKKP